MFSTLYLGWLYLSAALEHLTYTLKWKKLPGTVKATANMQAHKPAPNHVIFKKISRDKSVSGADVRGSNDDFFNGLFRVDGVSVKAL